MAAKLEIRENFNRLPANIETVLFRVLQEALTNVHRHSRSRSVQVRLAAKAHAITLSIQDHGKGIPPETLTRFLRNGTNVGVGLAGMRERIKELSGTLSIRSDQSGTVLKVEIPLAANPRNADSVISSDGKTFVA